MNKSLSIIKIMLLVITGILFLSVNNVSAKVTAGYCTDENIAVSGTCTIIDLLGSGDRNNAVIKVQDIDTNPPYQAEIKISGYWDSVGVYGYDEVVSVGGAYRYTNPSDSNDFIEYYITAIFVGGDYDFVELGDVNYQQTFYVSNSGSDSNYGNVQGSSWQTITHALDSAIAGTDIIVSSGTYDYIHSSSYNGIGTINKPIILKGDGSYPIISNEPSLNWGWTPDYIDISGFNIKGYMYVGSSYTGHISEGNKIHDNIINVGDHSAIQLYLDNNYDYRAWEIYNNNITAGFYGVIANTYASDSLYDYVYNNTFKTGMQAISCAYSYWYPYKNGVGNYYYYYTGLDLNGDKIGDTPYEAGYNDDIYPIMDRESGYVLDYLNNPIQGVYIYDVSFVNRNDTTDENGYYAISTTGRPTVSFGVYKEGYEIDYDTFSYDSLSANFTLMLEGGINNVSFSATTNKTDYITEVYYGQSFYVNTWINDSNYDPSNDSYYLRYKNPDGDIIGQTEIDQIDQTWLSFSSSQETGTYTYEIWSYRLDEIFASNTLEYVSNDYIIFDKEGKTNDNDINVEWYVNSLGWESEYIFSGVDYWYTQDVYPFTEYELVINVTPQGFGSFALKDLIIERNNFSNNEVMLRAYLLNTLQGTYTYTDYLLYQNESITPTPTPTQTITPIPTPTLTPTPLPTPTPPIEGNDTGTGWQANYSNLTQDELDYLEPAINGSFGLNNQPLKDLKDSIHTVNESLSSSTYQNYMTPLMLIVPPLINAIPPEIKALWTLYIVFILILIILGRE